MIIDDVPLKPSIYREIPIARFDYPSFNPPILWAVEFQPYLS